MSPLRRLRQEDSEFKASYIMRDTVSKKER
jgi:hypothetical protein